MVDSRSGSNLLYLPLDKLLQQAGASAPAPPAPPAATADTDARSTRPGTHERATSVRATARARATAKAAERAGQEQHEPNRIHRRRRADRADARRQHLVRRRPAPGRRRLRAGRNQGSHHRAGPEVQAAAAVPERRLPRQAHADARQPRDAADLHRREEEPGHRLAGQVAHRRAAPVHPQQRRRLPQPRKPAVRRWCRPRSTRRSPSATCAACWPPNARR